jgi:hypothetical protein
MRIHRTQMQMAVGISVHLSNSLISDMDMMKRIGPDIRVKGDTIRSIISTAYTDPGSDQGLSE